MALLAVASDRGAPGVTTASLVLAVVRPRPVLLAECDPAGGDLLYRFPAADGGQLDPGRGLLSLAAAARRSLRPEQVWGHAARRAGGAHPKRPVREFRRICRREPRGGEP